MIDYLLLLSYEFIVMFTQGKKYFASSDNYIDLMGYAAFIPTMILINGEIIVPDGKVVNFLLTIYILFLGTRGITQMRVFDGMRYLIRVLTQVGLDMREFMQLLTLAIVFFAAVETIMDRTAPHEGGFNEDRSVYFKKFNQVLNVGYGAYESAETYTWNRYTMFLLEGLVLPLVMFNFLVAIIS